MSLSYDGNFLTEQAVTRPFISYPFPQNDSRILTQEFEVLFSEYERTPISSPHPDEPTMYLVEESPIRRPFHNVLRFRRVYAEIPETRSEWESYANRYAGLSSGDTVPERYAVTTSTAGTPNDSVTAATGFTANAADRVSLEWSYSNGFISFGGTVTRAVISASGATITFPQHRFSYWSGGSTVVVPVTYTHVTNISDAGREPYTKVVQSEIVYDYFLPGISAGVNTHSDITLLGVEEIVTAEGSRTESYAPNSIPNRASYEAKIAAGTRIVAENSTARRWRGEIFERATRYVIAE